MDISVNGSQRAVAAGQTVAGLLAELEMNPDVVNVQLNGEIVPRSRFGEVSLKDGDQVEILMFMGGGAR
ncbi:MAG: sulfur carrier protein ThiS [Firmicutes bacterium]|nr:sulfur carrier protein ThiS [Bacillota bacterium]